MKINPGWRPLDKDITRPEHSVPPQAQGKSFSDLMQQQDEQASHEQLKLKLEQIQQQGERLAKSMTVRELVNYKQLIKLFLEETVRRGIVLKDTKGWDRRGRGKRYKLLDEIDRHLVEMAEGMLEYEQGRIDLLNKVGEIRGMLINLFF